MLPILSVLWPSTDLGIPFIETTNTAGISIHFAPPQVPEVLKRIDLFPIYQENLTLALRTINDYSNAAGRYEAESLALRSLASNAYISMDGAQNAVRGAMWRGAGLGASITAAILGGLSLFLAILGPSDLKIPVAVGGGAFLAIGGASFVILVLPDIKKRL